MKIDANLAICIGTISSLIIFIITMKVVTGI